MEQHDKHTPQSTAPQVGLPADSQLKALQCSSRATTFKRQTLIHMREGRHCELVQRCNECSYIHNVSHLSDQAGVYAVERFMAWVRHRGYVCISCESCGQCRPAHSSSRYQAGNDLKETIANSHQDVLQMIGSCQVHQDWKGELPLITNLF